MKNDKHLSDKIHATLKRQFGFSTFKGDQEAIILNLLGGNDTFVLMPTGGGKSLCYQLPSLLMDGTAIVVSPLIALMKNQVDVINGLSDSDGVAHYMNSSLTAAALKQVISDVREGKTKLLYVAPESLSKEENIAFLQSVKISFYAIDEAHCISEWGHDFRPEYRNIRPTINKIGVAPIIALTATATDKVRTDIKKNLCIPDAKEFKSSFNRPNLYYEVRQKTKDVDNQIVRFIKQHPGKSGIIYCLSRKKVEELAEHLKINNIRAAAYHAGLEQEVRSRTQDDFLAERIDIIVATIAFGMGIDKPDVRFVIHYDIPKSLEGYYQETGRGGRDGGEGICIAFYSPRDLDKLKKFMESKPANEQEIGRQLLLDTEAYAESAVCRRKVLLNYFGETYPKDNCGMCDNCLHPKEKHEAKEYLTAVIKAVLSLKEKFKQDYITDFVKGRATDDITSHKHEQLDTFGIGEDLDPKLWNAVIRQALIDGYLTKEVENYGLLRTTAKGRKFAERPESFMIVEDVEFSNEDIEEVSSGAEAALSPELYNILKGLQREVAEKFDVPPYVVFQDISLEQMATMYPVTQEELQNIVGVGAGKAKKFGAPFIEVIKRYCEENDIERPTDERIRVVAKKSVTKIKIIQLIDSLKPLDEIAKNLGLDFPDFLTELESIVYSGTKVNIDYFLATILDDDQIDEIYDWFMRSETGDIESAIEGIGGDYSEDEIRLVRLKFISEQAN
ncbi:MAG: DNA helicase RecQ [Prevotella sp.]|nr:DNA helicase RecQ [Prevotella sp.]